MKNSHIAFILGMITCLGFYLYLAWPIFPQRDVFMFCLEVLIVLMIAVVISFLLALIFDFGRCESCYKLTYTEALSVESETIFFCQHCQDAERAAERVKEKEEQAKEKEAIAKKLENERIIPCPHCHIAMKKEVIEDKIIVDKCETHGIWLDTGELTRLKKSMKGRTASSSSSSSSGSSDGGSNFALGLAVGMAM